MSENVIVSGHLAVWPDLLAAGLSQMPKLFVRMCSGLSMQRTTAFSSLVVKQMNVSQHEGLAFTPSYHCHSVDEHECTKDNLIRCLLFVCFTD